MSELAAKLIKNGPRPWFVRQGCTAWQQKRKEQRKYSEKEGDVVG